jgi:hypothetical protein
MTMRVSILAAAVLVSSVALADPNPSAPMRNEALTHLHSMEGNASRVQRALLIARATARVDEVHCLDASLSRADAAVRLGREEVRLALAAIDANDLVEARRQLRLLSTQREASRGAMKDADACQTTSNTLTGPSDQTVVHVTVDPTLPNDGALFPSH